MWFIKVGNRVTGPFNEDELRNKRLCKELAPFHLVSRDAIRWESAAQLIKLLDGAQPDWKLPQPPVPSREMRTDSREGLTPVVTIQWYYVDASRNQLGPIAQEALCDLLRSKQIRGKALVCKVGETQWGQARIRPELASAVPKGMDRSQIIAISAGLGIALAVILIAVTPLRSSIQGMFKSQKIDSTATEIVDSSEPKDSKSGKIFKGRAGLITALDAKFKKQLEEAVGFVVCGWTVRWKDGDIEEIHLSSGSCFAANADGYLVTNKHVIEDMIKRLRSNPEFQIADYCKFRTDIIDNRIQQLALLVKRGEIELPEAQKKVAQQLKLKKIYDTSYHQKVEPKVWVFFGSKERLYEAEIVHVSAFDMSVLKIKRENGPYFRMADSNELPDPRTRVWALGFPGAAREGVSDEEDQQRAEREQKNPDHIQDQFFAYDFIHSSDPGEVSRIVPETNNGLRIQHSATIKHGNSGGPLVTADGVVVGINTWGVLKKGEASAVYYSLATPPLLDEIAEAIKKHRSTSAR